MKPRKVKVRAIAPLRASSPTLAQVRARAKTRRRLALASVVKMPRGRRAGPRLAAWLENGAEKAPESVVLP